jgi:hypothetical protein
MPKFCTGTFNLQFEELRSILKHKELAKFEAIIEKMVNGEVLILKNTFSLDTTKLIKDNTRKFWRNNDSSFHKMYDGCPNFHCVIDEAASGKYASRRICHASYFFPWNEDDLGVSDVIMDRWRVIKELIGLNPLEYEKNIPSMGPCDRIQIVLYPPHHGFLETHSDPYHNQLTFMSGYLSTRGENNTYQQGGFYVVAPSGEIVDLEEDIVEGDFSVGLASIKHGVAQIDPNFLNTVDWYGDYGRWFLGLYTNDSDYIANRKTTVSASAD